MLEDAAAIRKVVIACGYVDLRKGINGLSMIIGDRYRQNPFEKGTLFLFCCRRSDRIKGLLWMGDGFLLLYKINAWNPAPYPGPTHRKKLYRSIPCPWNSWMPFMGKAAGAGCRMKSIKGCGMSRNPGQ